MKNIIYVVGLIGLLVFMSISCKIGKEETFPQWYPANGGLPSAGNTSVDSIAINGSNIFIGTEAGVFMSTIYSSK
jgi:hypothetical protein